MVKKRKRKSKKKSKRAKKSKQDKKSPSSKEKEESPIMREKKHQARRTSIKEGMFATSSFYFGNHYLSPFAIAINSSSSMVAMLSSISGLLGPITQLFSSKLIEKYSRKRIVLKAVFWEAIIWLPIILIGFLFYKGIITNILPLFFLLIFSIHIIISNTSGPAWFSWMGDIVDETYRGRWFAKRNLINGVITIFAALATAFFLDYFKSKGWTIFGFMILFAMAMILRLVSWRLFKKQYEPKINLKKGEAHMNFWSFLLNSPKNNFGKFSLFRFSISFAQSIAGPLFVVYILRNLNLSYTTYITITIMTTVFSIFLIDLWGKFADNYGNYRTIVFSSFLIPAIPILWTLSSSPLYLIFVPTIISGIAWSGFHLASGNFIYDNVSQEKRGPAVSYFNMLRGFGMFLGAGLGAILIGYLPADLFIEPIIFIFLLSGIMRMLS
ncbi:MFS transporter, partial [Candidatus Pacearchaeota archaeon]|nr:MFS transporter [Candidatus Pacearchaeota archaeon]